MAYQFRKLSQSFRFFPSSKSIGFSTRVNEGDQTKNSSAENTPSISSPVSIYQSNSVLNNFDVCSNSTLSSSLRVLRSQSESDLRNHLLPPGFSRNCSPVFYRDLAQLFQAHQSRHSQLSAHDSFFKAVKRVGPTSDDILFSFLGSQGSRGQPQGHCHKRERVKVDMFTKLNYQSLVAARRPADSLGLESVMLNNMAFNSGSDRCLDHLTEEHISCYCSSGGRSDVPKGQGGSKHGPTPSQLQDIKEDLEELVHRLFKGQHKYSILHGDIVMENNLFGENRTTVGISNYKMEILRLRIQIKFMFFSTSMEILNVTTLEQSGIIRIHWRLKGLPYNQFFKLLSNKKSTPEDWDWLEAFSYFHIGKDGKVHKHRLDRMMPDNEGETDKLTEKLRGFLNTAKPLVS